MTLKAYKIFFPLAMLHAAVILPLALVAMTWGIPATLASGPAHGGEMLAGYALAVMAGFLLPVLQLWQAMALLGCWLVARLAVVAGLPGAWIVIPNILFAAGLAALVVPRFAGAAKKLRNQATAPLVALIAATVSGAVVFVTMGALGSARSMLYVAVVLLAALLLFMGGRVLAPAAVGALQKQGRVVQTRVQPRLEGTILLSFMVAVIGLVVDSLLPLAALGATLAGLAGLVRVARWRLWLCHGRPDLWALGLGYVWVCLGLLLLGATWLGTDLAPVLGLHVITIGGLGTLSLNVMGRFWLLRAKIDPARAHELVLATLLVAVATILRAIGIVGAEFAFNQIAALAWSLAFAQALLMLCRRAPPWFVRHRPAN